MSRVLDIHPELGTVGLVLAAPLAAYAVVGEPIVGHRYYARLKRERERDPGALRRFYRLTLRIEWAWTALVAVIVVLAPGLGAASVGVALPGGRLLPVAVGFTTSLAVSVAVSVVILRRLAAAGKAVPGQSAVSALLPRTSAERRLAVAVALTAGICEEVLYRGLLVALLVDLLGLPIVPAALVAVVVFAVAHAYQGLAGMLVTGLLGAVLAALYVATGSLLLPILVHVLIDLRGLVLVPPVEPHSR